MKDKYFYHSKKRVEYDKEKEEADSWNERREIMFNAWKNQQNEKTI